MYGLVKCALVLWAAVAASSYSLGDSDVVFHLFTRSNPSTSQALLPTVPSIMLSFLNLNRPTIFTVHNHGESVSGNFNAFAVPALINAADVNVISVDWSPGSALYSVGLANAPQAGRRISTFINILIQNFSYNSDLITITGVGLGAHIAGIAARNAVNSIPRIVALDPSFHGWTHHPEILSPNAADLVEVLHTNAGRTGYDYPLGHLDFYANGGTYQAGCGSDDNCAHVYSYVFFAESVTAEVIDGPKFVGTACESYEEAIILQCSGNRDAVFGGLADKSASGIYTFRTNNIPPFAQH